MPAGTSTVSAPLPATRTAVTFWVFLRNTLLVCGLGVIGAVLSNAIVAYSFARIRWRGRDTLFAVTLATMMVPFPVIMAPLYILFRHLGWIGSFKPLWVPTFFGGAFSIFLLRQFFLTIPRALDEAAMLSDRVGVMSARPGVFIDFVETGWPRERDSRIVSDQHFGAITARLWEKLRAESLKAIGSTP